jgi:pimeloyl-ACP methyl ester carboxylesterase
MFTRKSARHRRRALLLGGLIALFSLGAGGVAAADTQVGGGARPTIVLVHGDWADASSWGAVVKRLQQKGFAVVAPPNLLRGPAIDAPYLASYLKSISGPIVLVAHSYGGFVATNAATGNANIKALVYIDAFMPHRGETAGELVARGHSCVDESALNPVPYDGGVDVYLRWDANPPYRGFTECSRTVSIDTRPPSLPRCSGPRHPLSSRSPPGLPRGRRSPPGR